MKKNWYIKKKVETIHLLWDFNKTWWKLKAFKFYITHIYILYRYDVLNQSAFIFWQLFQIFIRKCVKTSIKIKSFNETSRFALQKIYRACFTVHSLVLHWCVVRLIIIIKIAIIKLHLISPMKIDFFFLVSYFQKIDEGIFYFPFFFNIGQVCSFGFWKRKAAFLVYSIIDIEENRAEWASFK